MGAVLPGLHSSNLHGMTKKELLDYADEIGVQVTASQKKSEIIEAIEAV